MFARLLLSAVFVSVLLLPNYSTAYSLDLNAIIGRKGVQYLNGVPVMVTYSLYDNYGGNWIGSIVISSPGASPTYSVWSYSDLIRIMTDLEAAFTSYRRVLSIKNESRSGDFFYEIKPNDKVLYWIGS